MWKHTIKDIRYLNMVWYSRIKKKKKKKKRRGKGPILTRISHKQPLRSLPLQISETCNYIRSPVRLLVYSRGDVTKEWSTVGHTQRKELHCLNKGSSFSRGRVMPVMRWHLFPWKWGTKCCCSSFFLPSENPVWGFLWVWFDFFFFVVLGIFLFPALLCTLVLLFEWQRAIPQ